MSPTPLLPQRVAHVDFGKSRPPILMYTAPADTIVRFVAALKKWYPRLTIEVEPVAGTPDATQTPVWCVRAWANQ